MGYWDGAKFNILTLNFLHKKFNVPKLKTDSVKLKVNTIVYILLKDWKCINFESSQNFNSFGSFRQLLFSFILSVAYWVKILWGFSKFFFKQMLKVSAFYLQEQKSFIHKNHFWDRCQYQNKKALFTDPIFSEGFDLNV